MPYYHVQIARKNVKRSNFEMDLSQEKLQEYIVEPYHKGEEFFCGGVRIDPFEIEYIRISKTDRSFKELKPIVEKRAGFTHMVGAKFYVVDEGENVTREFIKHIPRKEIKKTDKAPNSLSKNIFIVHGRDHEPMKELKTVLYEFGLEPIILHEQPSGSRTIVEKLEKYSDVGYAFVILTPDDIGALQKNIYGVSMEELLAETDSIPLTLTDTIDEIYKIENKMTRLKLLDLFSKFFTSRPRQNVVLEFGYFIGKLGRDKVCCLYKGDIDLPSDMLGINYIPFKESVKEVRGKIVKELKAAGYKIRT